MYRTLLHGLYRDALFAASVVAATLAAFSPGDKVTAAWLAWLANF